MTDESIKQYFLKCKNCDSNIPVKNESCPECKYKDPFGFLSLSDLYKDKKVNGFEEAQYIDIYGFANKITCLVFVWVAARWYLDIYVDFLYLIGAGVAIFAHQFLIMNSEKTEAVESIEKHTGYNREKLTPIYHEWNKVDGSEEELGNYKAKRFEASKPKETRAVLFGGVLFAAVFTNFVSGYSVTGDYEKYEIEDSDGAFGIYRKSRLLSGSRSAVFVKIDKDGELPNRQQFTKDYLSLFPARIRFKAMEPELIERKIVFYMSSVGYYSVAYDNLSPKTKKAYDDLVNQYHYLDSNNYRKRDLKDIYKNLRKPIDKY